MRKIPQLSRLICIAILSVLMPVDDSESRSPRMVCEGLNQDVSGCEQTPVAAARETPQTNGVIVKFRPSAGEETRRNIHARHGLSLRKKIRKADMHVMDTPPGLSNREAISRYASDDDVEYAEPNYVLNVNGVPDDTDFGLQWNMRNTGQVVMGRPGRVDADINVVPAWDLATGSEAIVVAVIDTGVDYTHPDLLENMWRNPGEIPGNGLDDDGNGYVDDIHGIDVFNNDGNPMDDNGHGTHIAGVIGARGNNASGVAGVNWNVKVMACKFTDALGQGDLADAIECLDYVRMMKDRGFNVVATNNSYGLLLTVPPFSLQDAIATQNEILFVAAAGNNAYDGMGEFHNYPSDYSLPNIVSVAATDNRDLMSGSSNYGHDVHIGAPGVGIWSTFSGTTYNGTRVYYKAMTGTSMAAPHLTGAVALLSSYRPALAWWELRNRVLASGEDVPALAGRTASGRRLNVLGALDCLEQSVLVPWEVSIENAPDSVGMPTTLTALSANCEAPLGPVNVVSSSGETVELFDDGLYPDATAGDGLFSAEWIPTAVFSSLTFESPAGTETVYGRYPLILTTEIPPAMMFRDYSANLTVEGGQGPHFWSLAEGELPEGLLLNPWAGEISGVPLGGDATFTLRVQDRNGHSSTVSLSISVRTLEVLYAGYDEKDKMLYVQVDACRGADDLPVLEGYGPMKYDLLTGFWYKETDKVKMKESPETVTVTTDLGSAHAAVTMISKK